MRNQVLLHILRGTSDGNIRFADLRSFLQQLGFAERIKGSHHIFTHPRIAEIINLQPRNSMAKPYQVKQMRNILVQYKLMEGVE